MLTPEHNTNRHLTQSKRQKEHGDFSAKSPGSLRNLNLSVVGAQVRTRHLPHHISARLWNHLIKEWRRQGSNHRPLENSHRNVVLARRVDLLHSLVGEKELILKYKVIGPGQHDHMLGDNK